MRRPRAHVGSAELQSSERQALASHGDNDSVGAYRTVPISRKTLVDLAMSPVARREVDLAVKPTILPATLDGDVGSRNMLLDLVPGLAINRQPRTRPRDRSHARVVQLDARRFGWSRGSRQDALAENAARLLRKCRSPFQLVQADRPLGGGSRSRGVAGGAQHRRQRQAGVAVIDQDVGALGHGDGLLGHPPGLVVSTAARQQLCPNRAPGDRRLQRVAGETLTLRTQFVGLGVSVERETSSSQQRGGFGGVGVQAHATKAVVGPPQVRLGGRRIVGDQLDDACELVNLE